MRRQLTKRFVTGCVGIAAALTLTLMFALGGWLYLGARRLEAEVTQLHATDEPVTPEELEQYYTRHVGKSGSSPSRWADVLARLAGDELYNDKEFILRVSSSALDPTRDWDDQLESQELVARHRVILDTMHEAAAIEDAARYPTTFGAGFSSDVELFAASRIAIGMLRLEAQLAARNGDSEAIYRSISTMLAISESLESFPQISAQVCRLAAVTSACKSLAQLLPLIDHKDAQLRLVLDKLDRMDLDRSVYHALVGERVNGLLVFSLPNTLSESANFSPSSVRVWQLVNSKDEAAYLEHMRLLIDASQQEWPQKLESVRQLERAHDQFLRDQGMFVARHVFPVYGILTPAASTLFRVAGSAIAYRDVLKTVFAIEQFRRTEGEIPQELQQLVPSYLLVVPTDPFVGQPLKYLPETEQYAVYSVGSDQTDDAGTESNDISVRVSLVD